MDVSLFAFTSHAATRTPQAYADDVPLTEDVLRRLRESGL